MGLPGRDAHNQYLQLADHMEVPPTNALERYAHRLEVVLDPHRASSVHSLQAGEAVRTERAEAAVDKFRTELSKHPTFGMSSARDH